MLQVFGHRDQSRKDVHKILILLTDGRADDQKVALQEATALKRLGVRIIGIAAGTPLNIDRFITNLHALVADKSLVFKASFSGLDTIVDKVTKSTCDFGKMKARPHGSTVAYDL